MTQATSRLRQMRLESQKRRQAILSKCKQESLDAFDPGKLAEHKPFTAVAAAIVTGFLMVRTTSGGESPRKKASKTAANSSLDENVAILRDGLWDVLYTAATLTAQQFLNSLFASEKEDEAGKPEMQTEPSSTP